MSVFETMRLAVLAIARNRMRSLLTMLGVIIGVGAVIVTVAIGSGARQSISDQIMGLGSNLIIVIPGNLVQNGVNTGTGAASTLTVDDGLAIRRLQGVAAVSPVSSLRTQVLAGSSNWQTQVVGVAPTMPAIRQWPLARGTFFDDGAVRSVAKVCVLGQTVVDDLFPGGEPLGKTVIIRNVPFTIIGVLSRRGQSASGQDQDDVVVIPYTSAMQRLTGQTYLTVIAISANTQADVDPVQDRVARLLEERHHIVPPEQDDFAIRNLQDIAATASSTATVMETLLASDRRGVAARRRHRDHEHHAGLGHRADAGDRPAPARSARTRVRRSCSSFWPNRSSSRRHRRRRRRAARASSARRSSPGSGTGRQAFLQRPSRLPCCSLQRSASSSVTIRP